MIILLIVVGPILLLWLTGFLLVTDFAVPLRDARQFQRVLVLFPHADDETITCGGFLHSLSKKGSTVTLVLLTKGERGPNAIRNGNLKAMRTKEAQAVTAILGISRLIQEDFGDGELCKKKQELTTFLATLIEQEKPDLLLTYDLAGFYGHTDHITCSEIITELQKNSFPSVPLWYVTFPKRILARIKLPEGLARHSQFHEKQAAPTHKIFIGVSVFPKIKSWYTYKSQQASLAKGIGKFTPVCFIWFLLSLVLFEYFAGVSESVQDSEEG
ncbi:PIG-L deacetylase family protein [Ktedonobacter racemifer]|uniref:LmbE family protein n=1 Tax=Ktedonobacter racemifer DSM 44963 TaxID=485913 RepID=D6TVQ7_KTERA|nr:PIG-L family deacetylase [Ktedonobacter racemifer]EFH84290.1 LmbE family protein [Ktedonobacter racemifer DSM 44963]